MCIRNDNRAVTRLKKEAEKTDDWIVGWKRILLADTRPLSPFYDLRGTFRINKDNVVRSDKADLRPLRNNKWTKQGIYVYTDRSPAYLPKALRVPPSQTRGYPISTTIKLWGHASDLIASNGPVAVFRRMYIDNVHYKLLLAGYHPDLESCDE